MAINFTFHEMGTCRWATISHSFEAFGQTRTANGTGFVITNSPRGSGFWLQAMMGPRFDHPTQLTGKHGGQPTGTFVANLDAFLAECITNKINTVFCIGMCNDAQGTYAQASDTITNFTTIAQRVVAAGIRFVITNDAPAGSTFARTAGALRGFGRIQEFCMYELPRMSPLIIPVPIYGKLVAAAATSTGVPNTAYFDSDQLHPNTKGHFRYAYEIYRVLNNIFPVSSQHEIGDVSYGYNATAGSENKRGNILANGMFNGAGPTATSWTNAAAAAGITVTPTVGADADGTPYQQLAYTGTPGTDGGGHSFRQDPSTGNFSTGDKHRGSAYVLIKKSDANTGYTNLRGVWMQCSNSTSSPSANFSGEAGTASGGAVGDPWDNTVDWTQFNGGKGMYFRSPEVEITAPWSTETPFSRFNFIVSSESIATGAMDVVVQLRQAQWKKTFASANF